MTSNKEKLPNEKLLPIYTPLAATSRPQIDILSIFDESDENMIWFIAYFLSLSMLKGGDTLLFADEISLVSLFDICPMITSRTYDLGTVVEKWNTFTNFVTDQIEKGYYICVCLDVYYIEAYKFHYNKNHIIHPMLIYGYSDSENVIYGQDFFRYALSRETVNASQLESGIKNLSSGSWVVCFKKAKYNNQINVKDVMKVLRCHIESKTVYEDSIFSLNRNVNRFIFGIGCYDTLQRTLLLGCEDIPHRTCHAIIDHINILGALVRYLCAQNPLLVPDIDEKEKKIRSLTEKSRVYQNLCLKYNATKNNTLPGRIADMLPEIKREEESLLRGIYDGIDSYCRANAHMFPCYSDEPNGILSGFLSAGDIAETYLYDGNVLYTVTGDDPVLVNRTVMVDATAMKYIRITLSSTCESETAQIFFARAAGDGEPIAISEENSVSFTCSPHGDTITYIVDMTCCETWGGTVHIIRLDPAVFNNRKTKGEVRMMGFEATDTLPVYGSARDFCGAQGVNGWFYYSHYNGGITYRELAWDNGTWRGHNMDELEISGRCQTSRHNIASVRKWVCPADGVYEVEATYSQRGDSDLAGFVVKHDLEVLHKKRYRDENARLQGRYEGKMRMKRGEALFFEFCNPYQEMDDHLDIDITIRKCNDNFA